MSTTLVLTVIGEDRPGLVESLSALVSRFEANWEASHMARLGGRFAGIVQVSVQPERARDLAAALGEVPGLRVVVEDSGPGDSVEDWAVFRVELVGNDHPGIIRDISKAVASHGATVVELSSRCEPAPMSGGSLFKMQAEIRWPPDRDPQKLRDVLEALAHELMVDIVLA